MNQKIIIAGIAIFVGLLVPAYFLITGTTSSTTSDGSVTTSVPTSEAEAVFVNLASQLVPLSYDTTILSDPRFTSLVDLHTAVLPEQIGRKDPFAPLSGK